MAVSAEALMNAASQKTGLDDFGDTFSDAWLERWVADLGHPRLNETGRSALTRLAITDLVRRLQVVNCLARNPGIDDVEIPPIVYISGLERTGTTFLHNLLGLHPNARPMLRWELMRPTPPPEAATFRDDPRIAQTQASIDKLRGTFLEQMHWVDAEDPEECQWGLVDGSSFLGGSAAFVMPNWRNWYLFRDPETGFHEYRRLLKLLLWKNPVPDGGHLVLKSPQFAGVLPIFAKVFPEASFVLTHRDPYRVVVSTCALTSGILRPFMEDATALQSQAELRDAVLHRAERHMSALGQFADGDSNIANLAYPQLISDPVTAVDTVYRTLGLEVPANSTASIKTYVQAQKGGKRARPPKTLPDFGFDQDEVLSRPAVADYCVRFGVAPERERQTGVENDPR